jgi:hypothetical protein
MIVASQRDARACQGVELCPWVFVSEVDDTHRHQLADGDRKRINCDCLALMKAVLCFRKAGAALALVHSGA